jgi:uncharacterized protein YgfB (UPF0149 family)
MTGKQVLFWRIILIFIVVLGLYFIFKNISGEKKESIEQIVKIEKIDKDIDDNKSEKETAGKKIELKIRPDDFYKTKKSKN